MADSPTPSSPTPAAHLLGEIAAGLSSGGDLGALLQRFLEPVVRLAGAEGGSLRVLAGGGTQLHLVCRAGAPGPACRAGGTGDRHCGHCGVALDGPQVVWAADTSACAAPGEPAPRARRMLVVPLQHRSDLLGIYSLSFADGQAPREDVIPVLESVGQLLGLALHNARLEAENLRARLTAERQAMAAEVHDSLAQQLAFVRMRMPLLRDAVAAHDSARALGYLDDVGEAANQAHASLRGIITELRVPMDPLGLAHALETSAQSFRRQCGAALELVNDLPGLRLAPEQETQVFHIVQEALTNVARHASARQARLGIGRTAGGEVEIVVEDDGTGLAAGRGGSGHYGLEIMRERAGRLGGRLEVGARSGGGTRVRLLFAAPALGAA